MNDFDFNPDSDSDSEGHEDEAQSTFELFSYSEHPLTQQSPFNLCFSRDPFGDNEADFRSITKSVGLMFCTDEGDLPKPRPDQDESIFYSAFYFNQLYQVIQHLFLDGPNNPTYPSLSNYIQFILSDQNDGKSMGLPNFLERLSLAKTLRTILNASPIYYQCEMTGVYDTGALRPDDISWLQPQLEFLLTFSIIQNIPSLFTWIIDPQFTPDITWSQRLASAQEMINILHGEINDSHILGEVLRPVNSNPARSNQILFNLAMAHSSRYFDVVQSNVNQFNPSKISDSSLIWGLAAHSQFYGSISPFFKVMMDNGIDFTEVKEKFKKNGSVNDIKSFKLRAMRGFLEYCATHDDLELFIFLDKFLTNMICINQADSFAPPSSFFFPPSLSEIRSENINTLITLHSSLIITWCLQHKYLSAQDLCPNVTQTKSFLMNYLATGKHCSPPNIIISRANQMIDILFNIISTPTVFQTSPETTSDYLSVFDFDNRLSLGDPLHPDFYSISKYLLKSRHDIRITDDKTNISSQKNDGGTNITAESSNSVQQQQNDHSQSPDFFTPVPISTGPTTRPFLDLFLFYGPPPTLFRLSFLAPFFNSHPGLLALYHFPENSLIRTQFEQLLSSTKGTETQESSKLNLRNEHYARAKSTFQLSLQQTNSQFTSLLTFFLSISPRIGQMASFSTTNLIHVSLKSRQKPVLNFVKMFCPPPRGRASRIDSGNIQTSLLWAILGRTGDGIDGIVRSLDLLLNYNTLHDQINPYCVVDVAIRRFNGPVDVDADGHVDDEVQWDRPLQFQNLTPISFTVIADINARTPNWGDYRANTHPLELLLDYYIDSLIENRNQSLAREKIFIQIQMG